MNVFKCFLAAVFLLTPLAPPSDADACGLFGRMRARAAARHDARCAAREAYRSQFSASCQGYGVPVRSSRGWRARRYQRSAPSQAAPAAPQAQGQWEFRYGSPAPSTPAAPAAPANKDCPGGVCPVGATVDKPDLLLATVRIAVPAGKYSNWGSGTIISREGGMGTVLTCSHIFEDAGQLIENPEPIVERFDSERRPAEKATGELLWISKPDDLAIVRVPLEGGVAATIATKQVTRLDCTYNAGCTNAGTPTVLGGTILTVERYTQPLSYTVHGGSSQGRSGGGLFNARGELIGVCYGTADNEGFYTSLRRVRAAIASIEKPKSKPQPSSYAVRWTPAPAESYAVRWSPKESGTTAVLVASR